MPSAAQALSAYSFGPAKEIRRSRGAQPPDLDFGFVVKLLRKMSREEVNPKITIGPALNRAFVVFLPC